MKALNEVEIVERSTTYDIAMAYHSELKCENKEALLKGIEESDGKITLKPGDHPMAVGFIFDHSDPDRVIAVAQLILSFATMVKKNNQKTIDTSINEC